MWASRGQGSLAPYLPIDQTPPWPGAYCVFSDQAAWPVHPARYGLSAAVTTAHPPRQHARWEPGLALLRSSDRQRVRSTHSEAGAALMTNHHVIITRISEGGYGDSRVTDKEREAQGGGRASKWTLGYLPTEPTLL